MLLDKSNTTPLQVILAIITGVFAPLAAWLVRCGSHLLRRYNVLDQEMREVKADVAALQQGASAVDTRIVRVEDAIVEIRAAVQRSDQQFTAIMGELKQLPRLAAMVEAMGTQMAGMVSRHELAGITDRLARAEDDIRKQE